MHRDPPSRRPLPDWLVGLVLAIVIFAVGIVVLRAAGAGDDPAFETPGSTQGLALVADR